VGGMSRGRPDRAFGRGAIAERTKILRTCFRGVEALKPSGRRSRDGGRWRQFAQGDPYTSAGRGFRPRKADRRVFLMVGKLPAFGAKPRTAAGALAELLLWAARRTSHVNMERGSREETFKGQAC